jgi:electron transfer flavoprotein alpha subunit
MATRTVPRERLGIRLGGTVQEQVAALLTHLDGRDEETLAVPPLTETHAAQDLARDPGAMELPDGAGVDRAVVVMVEPGRTQLTRELLGEAARLARHINGHSVAIVTQDTADTPSAEWGRYGADEVHVISIPSSIDADEEQIARTAARYLAEHPPWAVLVGSTSWGRHVAARIAATIEAGLTGDATELRVENGRLIAWKPAFGGLIEAGIACRSAVQMVTVRPGVFPILDRADRSPSLATIELIGDRRVRTLDTVNDDTIDHVGEANTLIGIGQGVSPEDYAQFEPLRRALGAELVATRKVTDKGWLPRTRQVGLTGRYFAPSRYFAFGLSGRVNHMVGIRRARTIIAINNDPDALVFDEADFGLVADWQDVLPALIAAFTRDQCREAVTNVPHPTSMSG